MLQRADVDLKGGPDSEFVPRYAVLRQASVRLIYHWRELSLALSGTLDSKAADIRIHTS